IAVARQLAPGPAFTVAVVNGYVLAFQHLRRKHGVGGWGAAQRRDRIGYLELLAADEAGRHDLAFEIFRGEIWPSRRQARIIHNVRPAVCRSRARPGIRRPRVVPASLTASSRRYRRAASFSRLRRNAAGTARR